MSKILITSALPYINGVKHLGNLAGSLLPADIHARFCRQTGHEVLFLCGTDEHGTPAELAASAAGLDVAAYCARQHALQAGIYRRFEISFDHFSRTSGVANRALTQELPDYIKGFNWLTYEGGKFSTSQGRGIFTDRALDELPADYWRWWLAANSPENADADFTVERFVKDVNNDLADNFGNFVNRCVTFAATQFDAKVPAGGEFEAIELRLADELEKRLRCLRRHHEALNFRKAADEVRSIWKLANAYVAEAAPWSVVGVNPTRAAVIIRTAINLVRVAALAAWPFIPKASADVLDSLNEKSDVVSWPEDGKGALNAIASGRCFRVPARLFPKITEDTACRLKSLGRNR